MRRKIIFYSVFAEIKMKRSILVWMIIFVSLHLVSNSQVTDIDGNVYRTVRIGSQTWMAENLKSTKFNDGTEIGLVTDNKVWAALFNDSSRTPAYCWYKNDISNKAVYGALYNWYAVNTGDISNKNVCPDGWHIPAEADWTTMENYLIANGYNYDGTKTGNKYAKSIAATTNWTLSVSAGGPGNPDYPDYRDKAGFSAFPGGYRYGDGTFGYMGFFCYWWVANEANENYTRFRYLCYYISSVKGIAAANSNNGFSVRCMKD